MQYSVIAAVNNHDILQENLLSSPDLKDKASEVTVKTGFDCAGKAYNAGLDDTSGRVCVFAHQDVYFPAGWFETLSGQIERLSRQNTRWGVIGVYGVTPEGEHAGRVWTSGLGRELSGSAVLPAEVGSIDELVIVVNREAGLRFDEQLPGFHLYGTDIVQQARTKGFGTYVVDAPVVHNSQPVKSLSGAFETAIRYMRGKWRRELPIHTAVTKITRFGLYFRYQNIRHFRFMKKKKRAVSGPLAAPRQKQRPEDIAKRLRYE